MRKPVTCKIRLLDAKFGRTSIERTIELLKRIEATGVSAIGIHCRFVGDRPSVKAHWELLHQLSSSIQIPIIANGDFWNMEDIQKYRTKYSDQITSFMIARGAQENVSVFRREGLLESNYVMTEYVKLAILYESKFYNSKYCLGVMGYNADERIEFKRKLHGCKRMQDLAMIFGLDCPNDVDFLAFPLQSGYFAHLESLK